MSCRTTDNRDTCISVTGSPHMIANTPFRSSPLAAPQDGLWGVIFQGDPLIQTLPCIHMTPLLDLKVSNLCLL